MPDPFDFSLESLRSMYGSPTSNLGQDEVQQMLQSLPPAPQMDQFRNLQATGRANELASAKPVGPNEWIVKRDPETGALSYTAKDMPEEQVRYFQQASQFYQQALGGFAQEAEQIRAQEERARSQPWQQLATALSANLAQAKDMPGWVQGLGRTAAQLNPTADQLQARRLAVLGQGAQIAERGMAMGIAQQRNALEAARETRLQNYENAMLGMEEKRFNRLALQDKLKAENDVQERWDDRAAKGLFNATTFAKELKAANPDIKDEEVTALVAGKEELAAQAKSLRDQLGQEGFDRFKREQGVRFENDKRMAEIEHRNRIAEIALKEKGNVNPKTGKPFTQFELKEIAEIESTGILVQNLVGDLERRPDLFGPMPWTRAATWVKSWLDEDASRVRADYAHALPIMVQLLREGTRGYARNQREWVESKVPTTADTAERLKGKLGFIKGFLEARTKGLDQVFLVQQMARERSIKGESPYAVPSHAPTAPQEEIWTPERVKAEREKQRGGQ